MSHRTNIVKLMLVGYALIAPSLGIASSSENSGYHFNWGGFITQGWSLTSANNFYGQSNGDGGSFDFRELGLYGSYEANSELRFSGQLLSRVAGETQEGDIVVDHLLTDWSFLQQIDRQAGVRVGRIKNLLGFYNDTRDIAFTRTGVLLPQSIYQDRIRDISLSSDGIGFYLRNSHELGEFSFDFQYGRPQAEVNTELALLGKDWDGNFEDPELFLFRALYESPASTWRFALTRIESKLPFDAKGSDPFADSEIEFPLTGLSAQWNSENWSITGEYMHESLHRKGFVGLPGSATTKSKVYYIQLDRRFNTKLSGFLRYDVFITDRSDSDGSNYAALTGKPAHQRFAKDWTVGFGYQPDEHWLLRAEWHHVEGTAWLSVLDNPDESDTEEKWNMLLLQASYRF